MILTAEIVSAVPWPITLSVLLGLIGLLGIYVLLAQAVVVTRKAFGKVPPIHEQIGKQREEFIAEIARNEAELRSWMSEHEQEDDDEVARLEKKIEAVDDDVRALEKRISENGERRKQDMLERIEGLRKELAIQIHDNHEATQSQLNSIHISIGELRGELRGRNT